MSSAAIQRPQRWDVQFDPEMTEEKVERILSVSPFKDIDQDKFPSRLPLRGVLLNEAKLSTYKKGDIVVRKGDYGNSAFFILKGSVRVILETETNQMPDEVLGHSKAVKKSWKEALAQLWKSSKIPEHRTKVHAGDDSSAGLRVDGGDARVFLQDVPGVLDEFKTVQLPEGTFFGEIAALGRTPRTATIFSDEEGTELIEIKWQGLRDLRKYTPSIKEHIDKLYRKNSLNVQLRASELFKMLSEEELQAVADETHFKSVGDFDWHGSYKKLAKQSAAEKMSREPIIYEEGQYPESLLMVRAGFARVSYIGKGQFFGLREIAHNWRSEESVNYQHSLRSLGYVDILEIPAHVITKYVLPKLSPEQLPAMIKEKSDGAEVRAQRSRNEKRLSKTDVIEFAVENRYINGSATMLVNLDRCTRCDDCVRACATAHDENPRFVRDGNQFGNLMVGHSCMHCSDPVCMIGCPTGAIHRQQGAGGEVVINDTTCIGCATCANSCPYENITMVQVRGSDGDFIKDDATQMPIVKATKCDLCSSQPAGPSCQNACPHDALIRMDMKDPEKLMEWIRR